MVAFVAFEQQCKHMNKNRTLLNMLMAWLSQAVTVVAGLILPRLYLAYFGSETNGLIQSISQFLNYVNLLEGGLGSVFLASLYKPLAEQDRSALSKRVCAAQKYFRTIAFIFIAYTIVLSLVYPLIIKSDFEYGFISTLILILAIGLFVQFFFSITYKLLLQADRKVYVVLGTQITTTIFNVLVISLTIKYIRSIHIVRLISAAIFIFQPLIFNTYVNKHYKLDKSIEVDAKEELPGRWSSLGQNVAFFIHNNTDITLLSLISGLKTVSVYSVHAMVVFGLKNFIMAFSQVFSPKIGLSIAKDDPKEIERQIDIYEFVSYFISTLFFGTCICLIVPFVQIYTSNISDANYYQPVFAVILTFSEYVYCIRNPYIAVVYGAGKFKETAVGAYLEAAINILLSIALIWRFGLVGIAIGTSIAMTYRWIYHLVYLKNHIIFRSLKKPIKRFIISLLGIVSSYFLFNRVLFFSLTSVCGWILGAIMCFGIHLFIILMLDYCFDKDTFTSLFQMIRHKRRKNLHDSKSVSP